MKAQNLCERPYVEVTIPQSQTKIFLQKWLEINYWKKGFFNFFFNYMEVIVCFSYIFLSLK